MLEQSVGRPQFLLNRLYQAVDNFASMSNNVGQKACNGKRHVVH